MSVERDRDGNGWVTAGESQAAQTPAPGYSR